MQVQFPPGIRWSELHIQAGNGRDTTYRQQITSVSNGFLPAAGGC